MLCSVPSIVKLPGKAFAIAGSVLPIVIVPLTMKLMVSVPVPAAHPFTATRVLAAVIASRRAQTPAEPGSAVVLTIIGPDASGALGPNRTTPATAISPRTAAISKRTFAALKLATAMDFSPKAVLPREELLASTFVHGQFVHCQVECVSTNPSRLTPSKEY